MAEVLGNLVFVFLLVLANGFFVSAEFAIVKVRSTQIMEQLRRGHRIAPVAKHIVEHLDSYLSACQLGVTLASLGLGWVGEPLPDEPKFALSPAAFSFSITSFIDSFWYFSPGTTTCG